MRSSPDDAWAYLEQRFGVDRSHLDRFVLRKQSGDYWLVSADAETALNVETYGFRFMREQNRGAKRFKPTTYALQFLDDKITDAVVDVDRDELVVLLAREAVPRDLSCSPGYVAIQYADRIVGCGTYKQGTVSSRIPKGRGQELAAALKEKEGR